MVKSFHSTRALRNESHNTQGINPYFVTGLIDAEGSFQGFIKSSKTCKLKFSPNMIFQITQKNNDILYEIRLLFTNKKGKLPLSSTLNPLAKFFKEDGSNK